MESADLMVARQERIVRWSRVLAWGCTAGAIAIPALTAYAFWQLPDALLIAGAGLPHLAASGIPSGTRGALVGLLLVAPLILSYGLWRLRAACRFFAHGDPFGRGVFRSLQVFAVSIALSALVSFAARTLSSVLLSTALTGRSSLAVRVGTPELMPLGLAGLLFVFSWILAQAARSEAELRKFV